jgi:hypothetical protein
LVGCLFGLFILNSARCCLKGSLVGGGGEARARKDDKQVTKVLLFGLLLGDLFCFSSAHYFAQKEVLLLLHITLKILKVKFSLQTKGVIDS